MTWAQRNLLEKFAVGDLPLNRAIRAALDEIDRLRFEFTQSESREQIHVCIDQSKPDVRE